MSELVAGTSGAGTALELLLEAPSEGITLTREGEVAVLTYDAPGAPVNTINSRVAPVFAHCFDLVEGNPAVRAVVIVSGKADCWIAGADIEELRAVTSAADGETLSRGGQALLNRLAALRKPVVAALHGATLGGGLEVALACTHRIATEHPKTILALPEVQLGLIPGAGGTQRLPRLIGLRAALDMILTGKNVRAKKAWQLGLVHELVHPAILRTVAIQRARELGRGAAPSVAPRIPSRDAATRLLEDTPVGRRVIFQQARASVMKKTGGKYPAPLAALDVIARGLSAGIDEGLRAEAAHFGTLTVSPESRGLVSLFFATTALRKDTGLADGETATPQAVTRLGILGAGFMGAGIATVAIQAGTLVRLKDASLERVAAGRRAVRDVLKERLKRRQLTPQQFRDQLLQVGGTVDYSGFQATQLVIEAVFEDLAVKQQVLREVEAAAPDAIFASNTSTIPISAIAQGAARPERVVGMHFFSPVHKMPLLEVIVTPTTSAETIATVVQYGKRLGKTVIVVRDGAGFYVNRILGPYLTQSGQLLDEGVSIEAIDAALTDFGFPVGPITLLDEVGLDIAGKSGPIMADAFGARMQPAAALAQVIASGRLGRKAKQGFYRYDAAGKRDGVDDAIYSMTAHTGARRVMDATEIQRRTVLPMLNEAVRCLEDGIIRSPRDGDIGAVFGIGFPPFHGGPFRYLDAIGAATVVQQLDALEARFPGRFAPASRLRDMAARGDRFYPLASTP